MGLSEQDRKRLADIVALQPTKNAELQDRWGLDSGSEVHQYHEEALGDHYYRADNSLIRATAEAAELVDVKPGVEDAGDADGDGDGTLVIRVPALERALLDVLPEPDERSISVVATLQRIRTDGSIAAEAGLKGEGADVDVDVDAVRSALQNLRRKGAVEVTHRLVPTYRCARPRSAICAEPHTASVNGTEEDDSDASATSAHS